MFVHSGADLYGASRSLLRLTSRLAADHHAVLAVLPFDGPLIGALQAANVETLIDPQLVMVTRKTVAHHRGRLARAIDLPRSVTALLRAMRRFRPDLIHTNTSVILSSAIAAKLARKPHVWHIREFYADFPTLWPYHRRLITTCADAVVCVSGAVADQFGRDSAKVTVLHNGFPAGEFEPVSAARRDSFIQRFGLEPYIRIGIVGRIKFKRKGQETFVRAAALLAHTHPNARFVIVGSPFPGNEEHLVRLEALIDELGIRDRIVLTGDVEDVKAAYAALDVTVLASSSPEPFGGVVVEAMAMGKPVVGTRVGGTAEQIDHGVTGFLVTPDAPEEMAAALEPLIADYNLRTAMGTAARQRFLNKFEFEPFYAQVQELYATMLGRPAVA
jgi:glycosyltransferase involved in cell wall biosynthesis